MRIIYFGTDVFLPCFRYLAERHEIIALYTYHNDEDFFTEYSIVREAEQRGIPVSYGQMTDEDVIRAFRDEGCDLFFSAEYSYILPVPEGLEEFKGVNIHSALLPEGRGYYPIECAMERSLTVTGVTMHRMARRFDAGDILLQRRIEITPEMDSVDVYLASSAYALKMTKQLMENFDLVWSGGRPMDHIPPAWKRPETEIMRLSHTMTVGEGLELFRRYNTMTEVETEGQRRFVRAMMPGTAMLPEPVIVTGEDSCLYAMADGHLRLILV